MRGYSINPGLPPRQSGASLSGCISPISSVFSGVFILGWHFYSYSTDGHLFSSWDRSLPKPFLKAFFFAEQNWGLGWVVPTDPVNPVLSREGCGEWGQQGRKALGEAQNIRRQRWAGVCGDMEQRVSLGPAGYHRPSQTRVTSAHTYPMSTWAPSRRPEVLHQARLQLSICLRVTFCLRHRIPWCVGSAQGSPGRLPVAPAQAQQGFLAWDSSSTKAATLLLDPSRRWKWHSRILLKSPLSYKSSAWCLSMAQLPCYPHKQRSNNKSLRRC